MMKANDLPMLCANPDLIVDLGERRLYCAGALAQAYEAMGGTALYYGKPHPPIYDLARRRTGRRQGARIRRCWPSAMAINTDVAGRHWRRDRHAVRHRGDRGGGVRGRSGPALIRPWWRHGWRNSRCPPPLPSVPGLNPAANG
jgi:hypothetical protein